MARRSERRSNGTYEAAFAYNAATRVIMYTIMSVILDFPAARLRAPAPAPLVALSGQDINHSYLTFYRNNAFTRPREAGMTAGSVPLMSTW